MSTESATDANGPDRPSNGESATRPPEDEQEEWVEVEHEPPRLSQIVSVVAALIGVASTAPFRILALPFGIAGLVMVAGSVFVAYSRGWLSIGVGMILLGALITGLYGVLPPELLLVGVGATVVAWDAGQYGLVVGEQVGRQARSRRSQVVHIAASTLAITLVSAFVYLVYLFGGQGRPAPAVVTVVLGTILMAWLFRS